MDEKFARHGGDFVLKFDDIVNALKGIYTDAGGEASAVADIATVSGMLNKVDEIVQSGESVDPDALVFYPCAIRFINDTGNTAQFDFYFNDYENNTFGEDITGFVYDSNGISSSCDSLTTANTDEEIDVYIQKGHSIVVDSYVSNIEVAGDATLITTDGTMVIVSGNCTITVTEASDDSEDPIK